MDWEQDLRGTYHQSSDCRNIALRRTWVLIQAMVNLLILHAKGAFFPLIGGACSPCEAVFAARRGYTNYMRTCEGVLSITLLLWSCTDPRPTRARGGDYSEVTSSRERVGALDGVEQSKLIKYARARNPMLTTFRKERSGIRNDTNGVHTWPAGTPKTASPEEPRPLSRWWRYT